MIEVHQERIKNCNRKDRMLGGGSMSKETARRIFESIARIVSEREGVEIKVIEVKERKNEAA